MEFTTHFALQSQTTRLVKHTSYAKPNMHAAPAKGTLPGSTQRTPPSPRKQLTDGILTLSDLTLHSSKVTPGSVLSSLSEKRYVFQGYNSQSFRLKWGFQT